MERMLHYKNWKKEWQNCWTKAKISWNVLAINIARKSIFIDRQILLMKMANECRYSEIRKLKYFVSINWKWSIMHVYLDANPTLVWLLFTIAPYLLEEVRTNRQKMSSKPWRYFLKCQSSLLKWAAPKSDMDERCLFFLFLKDALSFVFCIAPLT